MIDPLPLTQGLRARVGGASPRRPGGGQLHSIGGAETAGNLCQVIPPSVLALLFFSRAAHLHNEPPRSLVDLDPAFRSTEFKYIRDLDPARHFTELTVFPVR